MRILVVEDDPVLGDGLSGSFRRAGYAVDTAQDGKLADDLLSVGPNAIEAHFGLGKLHARIGQHDEAKDLFENPAFGAR